MKILRKASILMLSVMVVMGLATGCGQSKNASKDTSGKNTTKSTSKKKSTADNFPKKNITMICPYSAGGGTDAVSRAIADVAKDKFGKPVVVENKTGGVGVIGMTTSMNAKPDGYTVGVVSVELVTLPKLGLAPETFNYKNYKPICLLNGDPCAITVAADAPWNTLQEFVDYAKAHPGEIKLGNAGSGSIWHLAAIGLEQKTGAKFKHVPYKGGANPAVVDLLGGHIDAVGVSPAEVAAHVQAGKLKILGIGADKRNEKFPDVKTYKEQGVDLVLGTWRGLCVPKDTPDDVVKILQDKFVESANDSKFVDFLKNAGLGLDVRNSADFLSKMESEDKVFDPICKSYLEQAK